MPICSHTLEHKGTRSLTTDRDPDTREPYRSPAGLPHASCSRSLARASPSAATLYPPTPKCHSQTTPRLGVGTRGWGSEGDTKVSREDGSPPIASPYPSLTASLKTLPTEAPR
jgi:hypothetical protein